MDRVLIVSEEVIFASHIEKTLKEVGFEVAIQSSESGLLQALQNFNPEILVVKGASAKLSSLRVGKMLKEQPNFAGKVILILNKDQNIDPNDIANVKMDYLLFEPVGAVKVVSHVLSLIPEQKDAIRLRLQKLTESDSNFRKQEELFTVSGKSQSEEKDVIHLAGQNEKNEITHVTGAQQATEVTHVTGDAGVTPEEMQQIKSKIEKELSANQAKYHEKIESYNKAIANLDVDLKVGHKKRQTNNKQKALRKQLLVDPGQEKLDSLDEDRRKFAIALTKRKV